ncbi:MAG: hypothetical protein ABJD23_12360, partial [Nonlabens sp.]
TDFKALLTYKTSEQGGRSTNAVSGYRPHIEFDNIPGFLASGAQKFINQESVEPGETVVAEIALATYYGILRNLNIDDTFKFCEGKNVIGHGKIIEFYNKKLQNTYTSEEIKNLKKRITSAVNLATTGGVLLIQGVKISIRSKDQLIITGFSRALDLGNITKESALMEIQEVKNLYLHWIGLTNVFEKFTNSKPPKFVLSYSDSKVGIGICEMSRSNINWLIKI